MAVTVQTLTELNDLAKDYFTNVYTQAYNTETPLKSQFGRLENASFAGKKWIFGVKLMRGGGSANAGANKSLPDARSGQFDQGEATVKRTYTRLSMDGFALETTKSQPGAFKSAIAEAMQDRLEMHDKEVNRQMFCNGDGVLFSITTGSAGASATQTPGVGTGGAEGDYGVVNAGSGLKHVQIGDGLKFYDNTLATPNASGTAAGAIVYVGTINYSTGAITLVNAAGSALTVDTVDNDVATRATSDTDNITAGEATGLLKSVAASGTLHAIPADLKGWQSVVLSNSGTARSISDSLVMRMITQIRARSGKTPNLVVTSPSIVLKYSELFTPLRRLDGQDVQLKGGYKPIQAIIHGGGAIPVMDDPSCPEGRMFFLNTAAFKLADVVGTEMASMDGAQFDRVTDKDAVEGYIRKYWELITINRAANGLISDISDDGISEIS